MAQRMESVAPPGGVMVSDSTARLVDTVAMLGDTEQVHIKGADEPVPAHRLLGDGDRAAAARSRTEFRRPRNGRWARSPAYSSGRSTATAASSASSGRRESARAASFVNCRDRGEAAASRCSRHTASRTPPTCRFTPSPGCCARSPGSNGLEPRPRGCRCGHGSRMPMTRTSFCSTTCWASVIPDAAVPADRPRRPAPAAGRDGQRRRAGSHRRPLVYVIEDAHWIDEVSESMLADFLAVVPQTPSLVAGDLPARNTQAPLRMRPRSQTIALRAAGRFADAGLSAELLGEDTSVAELAER